MPCIWLINECDPAGGLQLVQGDYQFTVPAASSYDSVSIVASGDSFNNPTEIYGAIDTTANGWTLTTTTTATSTAGSNNMGSFSGAGFVDANRHLRVGIGVDNNDGNPSDFDVNWVAVIVHYTVKL